MHKLETYLEAKKLYSNGYNKVQISKKLNIPRGTINDWLLERTDLKKTSLLEFDPKNYIISNNLQYEYSYILGLYLGDGYICKTSRTYKLRIGLDIKYNNINNLINNKLQILFPKNKVYKLKIKNKIKSKFTMIELSVHSNLLPFLFPQIGKGKKHDRSIELTQWQFEILDTKWFVMGLFHSDGCYYFNKKSNTYYYSFSNLSKQIIDLFQESLNILQINSFITKTLVNNKIKYQVVVGSKCDVKKLFHILGDKNTLPNNM